MFHKKRVWCISPVETAEQLAEKLTQHSWTLCTGFQIQGYLFLNDATSESGAQEYAVVKCPILTDDSYRQVESFTMSWCSYNEALVYIRRTLAGEFDDASYVSVVQPKLETPEVHGHCHLCQ
jgi:hypothetical protein